MKSMRTIARYAVATVLLSPASIALADIQGEIQHLLQYIENSGCEFERNGTVYDAKEARSHIERKYNHVKKHVDATEDFIKYAATESSISGRKYHVTCSGSKQASAEWLNNELALYRDKSSDAVDMHNESAIER